MKLSLISILLIAYFVFAGYVNKNNHVPASVKKGVLLKQNLVANADTVAIGTKTVISNLNVPWEIAWGPDNWIWFTEQSGTVSKVNPVTGERKVLLRIPEVFRIRSLGLLGMAIYPDKKLPYVFLDYTYKDGKSILSKLVRYAYTADTLVNPVILLKDIPGATSHNGSRVVISPDGKIMMSTGYATNTVNSQDDKSLNGKVLRLNIDGTIPADNPVAGSPIWTRGHRNPQGLVYDKNGTLFSSEHGDAIEDELNIIKKGGNYGWPYVEGFCNTPEEMVFCKAHNITEPVKSWTPVIAPSGIDYYNAEAIPEWKNSILLATLKTQSFRVLKLNMEGTAVLSERVYLDHQFGRLRDICVSPSGDVYVSTSNRDWNPGAGYPKQDDDKIIKLFKITGNKQTVHITSNPSPTAGNKKTTGPIPAGGAIYSNYCASCHKDNGNGVPGVFPSLVKDALVTGPQNALVAVILKGLKAKTIKGVSYDQEMPAFKFLSDKEVALVATYIRTHFGNKATRISTSEVSRVRKLN